MTQFDKPISGWLRYAYLREEKVRWNGKHMIIHDSPKGPLPSMAELPIPPRLIGLSPAPLEVRHVGRVLGVKLVHEACGQGGKAGVRPPMHCSWLLKSLEVLTPTLQHLPATYIDPAHRTGRSLW